jgi:hypothetical protein
MRPILRQLSNRQVYGTNLAELTARFLSASLPLTSENSGLPRPGAKHDLRQLPPTPGKAVALQCAGERGLPHRRVLDGERRLRTAYLLPA